MPCSLQLADEIEHLRHLAHRDRGRRLVHQHDVRVAEPRAGDSDRLPLAARHLTDHITRPRFGTQILEQPGGGGVHCGIVEDFQRADAAREFAAEKDVHRRA